MRSANEAVPVFAPEGDARTRELSMLVVGDLMLGRNVQVLGERYGSDYPFTGISGVLKNYDIVAGNLEGPVVEGAPRTPANSFRFAFQPASLSALVSAGFNMLSLANNHTFDFGKSGYEETSVRLYGAGAGVFGHPLYEGGEFVGSMEKGGRTLAFFGYNATYPSFHEEAAFTDIAARRASRPDELIFVFPHWGEEYSLSENDLQEKIARGFIDAGATAVFGSHPHVAQGVEIYKNRAIFYSLGNFVFDQYFSKETQEGLMISARIKEAEVAYELLPVAVSASRPELMDGAAREKWLGTLAARSGEDAAKFVMVGSFALPIDDVDKTNL
jgi:poly-gamma-glutamate synthesis protein (capsule biosynthesis protein)